MPAQKVSFPGYCLHKPSGRAYVRIHGKVTYCGDYGTAESKAEYGRLIAEYSVSGGCQTLPTLTSTLTIVELCDAYLDYAKGYYRKAEKQTRSVDEIKLAIRILTRLYGKMAVSDFGPLRLLAIQANLAEKNSRIYINKLVGYIKRIFKWGVSRQLISPSVHTALTTVEGLKLGRTRARESAPVLPVADELVDVTLPHLPAVVADMVRFQRLTGARPGEVCQIRPGEIDRSADVWQYRPADHKTSYRGRKRTIFIGPKAQAIFLPYLARDPQATCFSPAESERERHIEQRKQRRTRVQCHRVLACKCAIARTVVDRP